MKILLFTSTTSLFATVTSWDAANVAAKAVFKKQYWSDLYYAIFFDDGTTTAGSIDLEPYSFHKDHQNELFTWHLRTFWTNVSKSNPMPHLTQEDINFKANLLTYLPQK